MSERKEWAMSDDLVKRLRSTGSMSHAEVWETLEEAADRIEALEAENARLRESFVQEREENLWNAYATGIERNGEWDHCCMSDGEWLAAECGFDPAKRVYHANAIKEAIHKAAVRALDSTSGLKA